MMLKHQVVCLSRPRVAAESLSNQDMARVFKKYPTKKFALPPGQIDKGMVTVAHASNAPATHTSRRGMKNGVREPTRSSTYAPIPMTAGIIAGRIDSKAGK